MEIGCEEAYFKVALGSYVSEFLGCSRVVFVDLLVFCDEFGGGKADRRSYDR
jgi:hypothetical protein